MRGRAWWHSWRSASPYSISHKGVSISESGHNRRDFFKFGLGTSALALSVCTINDSPSGSWYQGDTQHILPLVSHQAFNIKVSFHKPHATPYLHIHYLNKKAQVIAGSQQDSKGRFWAFRVGNLNAESEYTLQLFDKKGMSLCDNWPLKTFPAPSSQAQKLRVITYTCAGGPDLPVLPGGRDAFRPVAYRQKLFERMLEKQPDLIIANGDHIYWDYRSWIENPDNALVKMAVKYFLESYGSFDSSQGVKGTVNETTLQAIADEQIGRAYGVRFRSTPVFFITDDHDYFDNDDATPELVTFPPNGFHTDLRNLLQAQYFPEYIDEDELPKNFPGHQTQDGLQVSTHFGKIQYGNLFHGLIYDCGGQLSLAGDNAGLIPKPVEQWLIETTQSSDCQQLIHFPSHPIGWTAGKWREWYPDTIDSNGTMLAPVHRDEGGGKYLWQQGWWNQHQRLVQTIHQQKNRKPIVVSGDLHLLGSGVITQSGNLDMSENPVHTILSGPVGVGGMGWLSAARGLKAQHPNALRVEDQLTPQETTGFTLLDISRDNVEVTLWAGTKEYVAAENLVLRMLKRYSIEKT